MRMGELSLLKALMVVIWLLEISSFKREFVFK